MDVRATDRRRIAPPCVALLLCVPLAACEALDTDRFLSNELIGAVAGGVGCAAVSKLAGGDDRQVGVAAVVCAAVGYGATKEMEDRRKAFATDEQFYAAESARLAEYERTLAAEVEAARAALDEDRMRVASLVDAAERSEARRADLERLNEDLGRRALELAAQLEAAREHRDYQKGLVVRMRETQGEAPPGDVEQLARLEKSVAELASLVDDHQTQTASLGAYL